jgi:hypothetical protein
MKQHAVFKVLIFLNMVLNPVHFIGKYAEGAIPYFYLYFEFHYSFLKPGLYVNL